MDWEYTGELSDTFQVKDLRENSFITLSHLGC